MTAPVDLANCASEPIHIPGSIQPQGALLAFDLQGRLVAWSANAAALLELSPLPGAAFDSLGLDGDVTALLRAALADQADGATPPAMADVARAGHTFDCVVHGYGQRVIAEFEVRHAPSNEVAAFALRAHAAIGQLKRQKSLIALMQLVAEQVREITGFDRVMGYRFRHDDSGDVVAEAVREDLPRYLGQRYPAGDIPAQARRLYTINTLRLIADVGYRPVPLLGMAGAGAQVPLDLSHSILRSVSPIHIEYLQNMGVGASMSVSIVVNGRLWGLVACHHMAPRQVPYSVRMACDVLAQVLAAHVQSTDARERSELVERGAALRTELIETLLHEDDVLLALQRHAPALCAVMEAGALVFAQHGKLVVYSCDGNPVDEALAARMVASLPAESTQLVRRSCVADWPEDLRGRTGRWVGMLALHFDPASGGWLLALRPEQVQTVRWGGRPDKTLSFGPNGVRLTPRGSFDEWVDLVHGSADPWEDGHVLVAEQLLAEMHRACMARHAELERARMQLLAMLGHDLRDPLQSITMAANVLQHGAQPHQLGQRIQRSSGRMQRLISQVLDMSRLDSGMGLGLRLREADVSRLLEDLLDESRLAHPGVVYEVDIAPGVKADVDPDRLEQVVSNLLSNARHHGMAGMPVRVALELALDGEQLTISVRNHGSQLPAETEALLFNPFKRISMQNPNNRTGMGLGLYIASRIAEEHRGGIAYRYEAPHVVFSVGLPRKGGKPEQ